MYRSKTARYNVAEPQFNYQLLSKSLSICLLTASIPLFANPTGGQVVAGSATIQYGSTTVITQHSNNAIVNWQDFSINKNETTQFVQPSSSSVILNRVVGQNASQIMGHLTSNGNVFLVNPNGIVFGKDAVVNVGGLMATTASISNSDFMSGNYHFTNAPADSKILNQGKITVAQAGYAALVAPNVENQGFIEAKMGTVSLNSGTAFTVDLYGDNLINLDASALVSGGKVINSGILKANGGNVVLSTAAATSVVESLINMSGYISANTVGTHNGKVQLIGGKNSNVQISGTINTVGKHKGETGGVIQATGTYVQLLNGSKLDASGSAGGGNINIGSDVFHGPYANQKISTEGTVAQLANADYVYAAADSSLIADSLLTGDAGNIIAWAAEATWFYGKISAQAKGSSGNGGRIETSGHYLDVNGISVNASSTSGQTGVWLMDPFSVVISPSGTSGGSFSGGNPNTFTPSTSSFINQSDLSNNLLAASVIINTGTVTAGSGSGTVSFFNTSPIFLFNNSLTVFAASDILINGAGIESFGIGNIVLRANDLNSISGTNIGTVSILSGTIQSMGSGNITYYYNPQTLGSPFSGSDATLSSNIISSGSGTITGYQLVNTASQLQSISANSSWWNQNFALNGPNADINLTGYAMNQIGDSLTAFSGIFTGLTPNSTGNVQTTVTDLTITGSINDSDIGMFGQVSTGTIDNISLISPTIAGTNSSDNIGGIIGLVSGNATLSGIFSVSGGTVTGGSTTTGLGGVIGTITGVPNVTANMTNSATVQSTGTVHAQAGVIGYLNTTGLTLSTDLTNNGNITTGATSVYDIGGVIGVTGPISSPVAGNVLNGTFTNTGNINSGNDYGEYVGGVFGFLPGYTTLSGTYINTGAIQGEYTVGGIIGGDQTNSNVLSGSFTNNGPIEGHFQLGGIGGEIGGTSGNLDTLSGTFTNNSGGIITSDSAGTYYGGIFAGLQYYTFTTGSMTNNANFNTSNAGAEGGIIGALNPGSFGVDGVTTVTNNGAIPTAAIAGGIFAYVNGATIAGTLYNYGTVTGSSTSLGIGGIAGDVTNATTLGGTMYSYGSVSGGKYVGGIIGALQDSTLTGSYTYGNGTANTLSLNSGAGNMDLGGFIGLVISNTGTNVISGTGTLAANVTYSADNTTTNVGGMIGEVMQASGSAVVPLSITASFTNNSPVNVGTTGASNVGGFIGEMDSASSTNNTFSSVLSNSVAVTGQNNVGGLIGLVSAMTVNGGTAGTPNTNSAIITGVAQVGGLYGSVLNATLDNVFTNTGATVSGTGSNLGGIIGLMTNGNIGTAPSTGLNGLTNSAEVIDTGSNTNVGGVIGSWTSNTTSTEYMNLTNNGLVYALNSTYVGGLFGSAQATGGGTLNFIGTLNENGDITAAQTAGLPAVITGAGNVGGMFGQWGGDTGTMSSTNTLNLIFTNPVVGTNAIIGYGDNVGGIIGIMGGGTGTSQAPAIHMNMTCTSTGTLCGISGYDNVGGGFGYMGDGSINQRFYQSTDFNVIGSASGTGNAIGGLIGLMTGTATFAIGVDMYGSATVTDNAAAGVGVGELIGSLTTSSTFTNSSWLVPYYGSVYAPNANDVGGIIGHMAPTAGTVTLSGYYVENEGTPITGNMNVGGNIGSINPAVGASVIITSATFTPYPGTVTGITNVGGAIGYDNGTAIPNGGSANATVMGTNNVGGFIGQSVGVDLSGTYSFYGNVTGTTNVGGLFGLITGGSTIDTTANFSTIAGGTVTGNANVGGLIGNVDASTSYLTTANTFINNLNVTTAADINTIGGIFGTLPAGMTIGNALTNAGTISSTFSGSPTSSAIGGITGDLNNNTFTNTLTNSGTVTGVGNVGGFFGELTTGASSDLSAATFVSVGSTVEGLGNNIGGIIGIMTNGSLVPSSLTSDATVNADSGLSNFVGGIFGDLENATLSNNFTNDHAVSGAYYVGGIAGQVSNSTLSGVLTDISTGTVTGNTSVGGIIGQMTNSTAVSMSATGDVSGDYQVGGLVGLFYNSSLTGTISYGSGTNTLSLLIPSGGDLGGLVGYMFGTSSISSASATLNQTNFVAGGGDAVGGIVGLMQGGSLSGTFNLPASMPVDNGLYIGGFIGEINSITFTNNLTNSMNIVAPTSTDVGGVIGYAFYSNVNATLVNNATVSGLRYVGGVIGATEGGSINGSLTNNNSVTGSTYVGGVLGGLTQGGTLNSALVNTGSVTGTAPSGSTVVGGDIGYVDSNSTLTALSSLSTATSGSDIIISGAGNMVGGLIGYLSDIGLVFNTPSLSTTVSGGNTITVSGVEYIGGLIGIIPHYGTITTSNPGAMTNYATVTGTGDYTGGIIGSQLSPQFNDVNAMTNYGAVSGVNYVGGIMGNMSGGSLSGTLTSNGSVTASGNYLGGIMGGMTAGTLSGNLVVGDLAGDLSLTFSGTGQTGMGGVVGYLTGLSSIDLPLITINPNSTPANTFNASSASGIGGVIGLLSDGSSITPALSGTFSTNALTIDGSSNTAIGAIIGLMSGASHFSSSITNATALTSTQQAIGGVIGEVSGGTINATLSNTAPITGVTMTGGVIGYTSGATLDGSMTNAGLVTGTTDYYTGGVIGRANASSIHASLSNSASVMGSNDTGGIIGGVTGGTNIYSIIDLGTASGPAITIAATAASTGLGFIFGDFQDLGTDLATTTLNVENNVSFDDTAGGIQGVGGIAGFYAGSATFSGFNTSTYVFNAPVNAPNSNAVGGIIGLFTNSTLNNNLSALSNVTGYDNVGGVIGSAPVYLTIAPGTINASLDNTYTVTGHNNVGGDIGYMQQLIVNGALTNEGSVNGDSAIGGNVGGVDSGSTFSNTSSLSTNANAITLNIIGTGNDIGGLIGYISDSNLDFEANSLSTNVSTGGVINVQGVDIVGGLIGLFDLQGTMTASNPGAMTNYANVSGSNFVGGIFGQLLSTSFTTSSSLTNAANVSVSNNYAGGIVGEMQGGVFAGPITLGDGSASTYTLYNAAGLGLGGVAGHYTGSSSSFNLSNVTINTNVAYATSGSSDVGGAVGLLDASAGNPTLTGTFATNPLVLPYAQYEGAIIGEILSTSNFSSTITNSTNVTSNAQYLGGVAGYVANSTVSGSFANTGTVTNDTLGISNAGGVFAGTNNAIISASISNSGDVSGISGSVLVGGDIGYAQSTTFNAALLATGGNVSTVAGEAGGLIGQSQGSLFNSGSSLNFNAGSSSSVSTAGSSGAGGLIGLMSSTSVFNPSSVSLTGPVTVSGDTGVGGLFGLLTGPVSINTAASMSSDATVIATGDYAGGLIGENISSTDTFTGSLSSTGSVSGVNYVGGLFGYATGETFNTGTLSSSATVSGTNHVGGLVGYASTSTSMTGVNTYSGTVTGTTDTGGIVGTLDHSTLSHAGLLGTVNGTMNSGGIVGNAINGSTVSQSYNNSNHTVNGGTNSGGIAGLLDATSFINDVLFGGTITATAGDVVGGIVGLNLGTVNDALFAGTISTSEATVGAIIGDNTAGTITNSFFDTRHFAVAVGSGSNSGTLGNNNNFVLQGPAIYQIAGWDFTTPIWLTTSGYYPSLAGCTTGCTVALPYTPPSPIPPSPGLPPGIIAGIQNSIYITETTNILDPLPIDLTGIDVQNLASAYANIVEWLQGMGIPTDFLNSIIFVQTNTIDPNLTSALQAENTLITLQVIVQALSQYYCGK